MYVVKQCLIFIDMIIFYSSWEECEKVQDIVRWWQKQKDMEVVVGREGGEYKMNSKEIYRVMIFF